MALSNLQIYTLSNIYINGTLLTEHAEMSMNRATNSQAVATVAKGYAGESPGAAMTELQVVNACPAASYEYDPGAAMNNLDRVEFTVFASGKTATFKGFIISDGFRQAVNSAAQLEFSARGQFGEWQ